MDTIEENLEDVRFLEDELFMLDARGWLENEFLTWEWWILLCFLLFHGFSGLL
ncbi:hypothetical protein [Robertmurraya sp. FSL R5-0851]|uniref:hypothetical protein n=1 Tax=Robertmurraya sp. FSL R5-0851 TaxID=2921584 RepID=UPI0030F6D48E